MSEDQMPQLHRDVSQTSRKIQSSYETAQITLLRMTTPVAVSANYLLIVLNFVNNYLTN